MPMLKVREQGLRGVDAVAHRWGDKGGVYAIVSRLYPENAQATIEFMNNHLVRTHGVHHRHGTSMGVRAERRG